MTTARPLVIGFSASALLDAHATGAALAERLLGLNRGADQEVDVVVLSKEDPEAGVDVLAAIRGRGFEVHRCAFTGNAPFAPYLSVYRVDLFLSDDEGDVREASRVGVPAGLAWGNTRVWAEGPIRVAIDADALTLSSSWSPGNREDESPASHAASVLRASAALDKLVAVLARLRSEQSALAPLLRTALLSSRGSADLERLIHVLGQQGIRFDEAFGVAGLPREEVLQAFGPQILVEAWDGPASTDEKPADACASGAPGDEESGESAPTAESEERGTSDSGLTSPFDRLRFRSNA